MKIIAYTVAFLAITAFAQQGLVTDLQKLAQDLLALPGQTFQPIAKNVGQIADLVQAVANNASAITVEQVKNIISLVNSTLVLIGQLNVTALTSEQLQLLTRLNSTLSGIPAFLTSALGQANNDLGGLLPGLLTTLNGLIADIGSLVTGILEQVAEIARKVLRALNEALIKIINIAGNSTDKAAGAVVTAARNLTGLIQQVLNGTVQLTDTVIKQIAGGLNDLKAAIANTGKPLQDLLTSTLKNVDTLLQDLTRNLGNLVVALGGVLTSGINTALGTLSSAIRGVTDLLSNILKNLSDLVSGLFRGIIG